MTRLCRIWDRAPLAIDYAPGQEGAPGQGALVLAFSSIGHDPARMPAPEFIRSATAQGRAALFIADQSRSWANTPDFAPALHHALAHARADAAARGPVSRIAAIGLSMGGFAALVAASLLPVDVTLAIGPQFSVDPAVMPQESRWRDWTARIPAFRHPTAPQPPGWTILLHGLQDDRDQALAFPSGPATDHILFPSLTHSALGPHLKARGGLQGLLDAALAGDRRRLLRIATAAGGQRHNQAQLPR